MLLHQRIDIDRQRPNNGRMSAAAASARKLSQRGLKDALRFIDDLPKPFRIYGIKLDPPAGYNNQPRHRTRGEPHSEVASASPTDAAERNRNAAESGEKTAALKWKHEDDENCPSGQMAAATAHSGVAVKTQHAAPESKNKATAADEGQGTRDGSVVAHEKVEARPIAPPPPQKDTSLPPRTLTTDAQREALKKQNYELIGTHSAVKLCRWTKNAMKNRGQCYKHTFYGISSHQCMEMTPNLACANKCVFCWRNHTNPVTTKWKENYVTDSAEFIVEEALARHQKKFVKQVASGLNGVRERKQKEERSGRRDLVPGVEAEIVLEEDAETGAAGLSTDEGSALPLSAATSGSSAAPAANTEAVEMQILAPAAPSAAPEKSPMDEIPAPPPEPASSRLQFSEPFSRLLAANTVRHCALSLVGEPVLYPHFPELLQRLYAKRISTFVVTNGQFPDSLEHNVPPEFCTQLYVSVDASNEHDLRRVGRPLFPDAWDRLKKSLAILREKFSRTSAGGVSSRRTRTVLRLTYLLTEKNAHAAGSSSVDSEPGAASAAKAKEFAALLATAEADFVEVKGATFAPQVFSKHGLTQKNVPTHTDVVAFATTLKEELNRCLAASPIRYGLACEHHHSCGVLIAREDRWLRFANQGSEVPPQSPFLSTAAASCATVEKDGRDLQETGGRADPDHLSQQREWHTWIDFDGLFDAAQKESSAPADDGGESTKTPDFALFGSAERGLSPADKMRRSGCRPDEVEGLSQNPQEKIVASTPCDA